MQRKQFVKKIFSIMDKEFYTIYQMAQVMGVSYPSMYRYLEGRVPRRRTAAIIQHKTQGMLTMKDFGYE